MLQSIAREPRSPIDDVVHLACVAPDPTDLWVRATVCTRAGAQHAVVHVAHPRFGPGHTLSARQAREAAADLRSEWTGDRARHLQLNLMARRLVNMAAQAERLLESA